jgi:hypothetical protein
LRPIITIRAVHGTRFAIAVLARATVTNRSRVGSVGADAQVKRPVVAANRRNLLFTTREQAQREEEHRDSWNCVYHCPPPTWPKPDHHCRRYPSGKDRPMTLHRKELLTRFIQEVWNERNVEASG